MPVLNLFNGNVFGGTLVVKSVPDFIKIKFRNKDEHRALVRRREIIFCYFKFIPGLSWIYWLNLHSVTATEVNFIGDCVAGTYCGGKREPGFSSPTRTITLEKPQVHTFFSLPPLRKPELFSSSYTSQSRLSCLLSELVVDGASLLNQRSIQGTHRWLVELWRFWKTLIGSLNNRFFVTPQKQYGDNCQPGVAKSNIEKQIYQSKCPHGWFPKLKLTLR